VGFVSSIYFLNRYVAIFGHIPVLLRHIPRFESFFIVGVSLALLTFSCLMSGHLFRTDGYSCLSLIQWPLS
jgi:hypothetical protein